MKASEFKSMTNYINENGFDDVVTHAGYMWLRLTDKQVATIRKIAIDRGYTPDENGYIHIDMWVLS